MPYFLLFGHTADGQQCEEKKEKKVTIVAAVDREWPFISLVFFVVRARVFGKNRARFLHHLMDYAGARTEIPVSTYSSCNQEERGRSMTLSYPQGAWNILASQAGVVWGAVCAAVHVHSAVECSASGIIGVFNPSLCHKMRTVRSVLVCAPRRT